MKCSVCKAPVKKGDGRFCSHCGTVLPDAPRMTPEEWTVHPERFDEAAASDAVARAMTAPAPPASMTSAIFAGVFLCFWLGIGSFMFIMSGFAPWFFRAFLTAMLATGAFFILKQIAHDIRFARARVERHILVAIDKRTAVSGGGDDQPKTTKYFATLTNRDGERTEYQVTHEVAGHLVAGDIGLALLRLKTIVAFHRA